MVGISVTGLLKPHAVLSKSYPITGVMDKERVEYSLTAGYDFEATWPFSYYYELVISGEGM